MLRKVKPKLSEHEYKVLYPSGSSPGKLYGATKIHNVPENGNIDQLLIRPIVSNLNTATYQLAKFYQRYYHIWKNLNTQLKVQDILWR